MLLFLIRKSIQFVNLYFVQGAPQLSQFLLLADPSPNYGTVRAPSVLYVNKNNGRVRRSSSSSRDLGRRTLSATVCFDLDSLDLRELILVFVVSEPFSGNVALQSCRSTGTQTSHQLLPMP